MRVQPQLWYITVKGKNYNKLYYIDPCSMSPNNMY